MPYQNIFIDAAEVQAVKAAIATLQKKLPFLANLTVDEREAIFKTGTRGLFLAQRAPSAAPHRPERRPQRFQAQAFTPDVDLVTVLTNLVTAVEQLIAEMASEPPTAGGEAMKEATQVYTYVKTAAPDTTVVKLCFSVEVYNYVETATGNT